MGIDISVLCVLCVLRGGAIEVPRINASAHHDLLRAFAVHQTPSAGPARTSSGPGLDGVWTGFSDNLLLGLQRNTSKYKHWHRTMFIAKKFSSAHRARPLLPRIKTHHSASL